MFAEKVQGFPVLYNKIVKDFKARNGVRNACEIVVESLDFADNGNFIRTSSNRENTLKMAVLRNWCLVLCPKFLQNISKPIGLLVARQFSKYSS